MFAVATEDKREDRKEVEIAAKTPSKENFDAGPYAAPPAAREIAPQKPEACFCLLF